MLEHSIQDRVLPFLCEFPMENFETNSSAKLVATRAVAERFLEGGGGQLERTAVLVANGNRAALKLQPATSKIVDA